MAADITPNDRKVMAWIDRMRAKHGPVVREHIATRSTIDGDTDYQVIEYDWGEALARAHFGWAWIDIVKYADPHAPDAVVALAERWEAGEWPDWCERSDNAGET